MQGILYLEILGGPVKTNHPVDGVEKEKDAFQQLSVFSSLNKASCKFASLIAYRQDSLRHDSVASLIAWPPASSGHMCYRPDTVAAQGNAMAGKSPGYVEYV